MAFRLPMNLLLDSCALIALANNALPENAHAALESGAWAYVSSLSVWEIAIKVKSGKLSLPKPVEKWFIELCEEHDLQEIPFLADLACAAADLPLIHRDPFDRALIATAMERKLTLLTSDKIIPSYPGITTLW